MSDNKVETELLSQIKEVLLKFPKYWEKDVLLRNKVAEDLRNYNQELIEALLSNQLVKDTYSISLNSTNIFKIEEFISMLRYKNYWENSYTKYSNEIGLTSEGKYLNYNTDVVLDFPHKDSVLEGGMTKEDQGKEEIYYHNVLAKEEIDTLLSPKVLTNIKKYDKNGEHDIDDFTDKDNLIIRGNNLIALYSLKERYENKIKMIYIDVPYYFLENKEYNAFKYNSNFQLSSWLVFLKNRIEIARKLLTKDGSLWIHVGEDGMHYLKTMLDEVFGADKFVGTIPRKTREGKNDVPFNFSQDFDFILVYTNGVKEDSILNRKVNRKYIETPDFPDRPWRRGDIKQQKNYKERPNSYFDMVNPKTGKNYPVDKNSVWRVTKDTFNTWYSRGHIGFPDDYDFMTGELPFRRTFKDEDDAKEKGAAVFSDFLLKDFVQQIMGQGKTARNDIVAQQDFNYAKPESLIASIIEVSSEENDLILDFFMGSATTQAVAHKMNRQYIGIEQMDYINTVSVPRLQKVIEGEQGGISEDVDWKGGGSFVYAELTSLNDEYIKNIQASNSEEELEKVLFTMKESAYFNFKVDLERVSSKDEGYHALSLEEKKEVLIQVLDMNQLYLSYSEIEDEQYKIPEDVKAFNHSFYQKEGVQDE